MSFDWITLRKIGPYIEVQMDFLGAGHVETIIFENHRFLRQFNNIRFVRYACQQLRGDAGWLNYKASSGDVDVCS